MGPWVAVAPSMLSNDVLVRRATSADRAIVLALLAEYLPGTDVERRLEWLYERNPHGRALTYVAFEEASGAPMGLTSLFPRKVAIAEKQRLGSIGGDGFVRPIFRRRGVATKLHTACLGAMTGAGIEFMYGAPEPNNLQALIKAGSRVVTQLRRFARPRAWQRAARIFAKIGCARSPELLPLEGADARVDAIWERASGGARVMPVRDAAHYAWRF